VAGRPSPLQHLWSLAIEEQFYLLWPPLLALALWGRGRRLVLPVALAGAAGSAALMARLYHPGADPSRVYYGTDTRAAGLLAGAALALAWAPWRGNGRARKGAVRLLDAGGLAALGLLLWLFHAIDGFQPALYRGGLAAVDLATAAAIAAAVAPGARLLPGLLEWRPLRWVGVRSYGIYLWHWPVFVLTRPELDVPLAGPALLALRLAATVLLAHLSYRYVEKPIRQGALGRAWRSARTSWREAQGLRRWQLGATWAAVVVPAIALCAALGVSVAYAKAPAPPSYLTAKAIHTTSAQTTSKTEAAHAGASKTTSAKKESASTAKRGQESRTQAREKSSTKPEKPTGSAAAALAKTGPVTAVGDSVMLGAATHLERTIPNLTTMDAQVGLQVEGAIDILRERRAAGQLGDIVLVHVGNNGTFTTEQFDEMMSVLSGVREVVFVNVNVPRPWERPDNAVLAAGVRRYPNAVLVDWYSASVNHPEYFVEDGVHLQIKGQRVYSRLIAERIAQSLAERQRSGQ
jgi:hypothetical protein